jgi:hypothetical protein
MLGLEVKRHEHRRNLGADDREDDELDEDPTRDRPVPFEDAFPSAKMVKKRARHRT